LVAVVTDNSSDGKPEKNSKIVSAPLLADDASDSLPADARQCAKSNLYEPEPRALAAVKFRATREGNPKNSETRQPAAGEYCPMNGTETLEYLQPVSDRPGCGYLPMGPPPDYDNCVDQNPPVSYENTEKVEPTIDTTCEPDCGMMGYDIPPPMHVYSEIPGNDDDDVDEDGNHIYESLDQADLQ